MACGRSHARMNDKRSADGTLFAQVASTHLDLQSKLPTARQERGRAVLVTLAVGTVAVGTVSIGGRACQLLLGQRTQCCKRVSKLALDSRIHRLVQGLQDGVDGQHDWIEHSR